MFSQRGKPQRSPNASLCAVSACFLASGVRVVVCLFVLRCVKGRLVFGGLHTNHTSVERLGSVDAPVVAILAQSNIPIVAPLHATRRGSAAFGCAVMVGLPQTAPVTSLGNRSQRRAAADRRFCTRIFSWLGSGVPLRTRLRDVVNVPADLWQATVRDLRIPQGETQRDPHRSGSWSMSQWCGAPRVYAWASLRPHKEVAAAHICTGVR